jgi:hypothetical protein
MTNTIKSNSKPKYRPHITKFEADCKCGCGSKPMEGWLDTVELFHVILGRPNRISTMARCPDYNAEIGGHIDSPHLLYEDCNSKFLDNVIDDPNENKYGSCDESCHGSAYRMKVMEAVWALKMLGRINHIEVADGHIHFALVPVGHTFNNWFDHGQSK